jgi:hypothetical protein
MPDTTEPHHNVTVRELTRYVRYRFVHEYQATCATCGYVGRVFQSKRDAETDGDEHAIHASR